MKNAIATVVLIAGVSFSSTLASDTKNSGVTLTLGKDTPMASVTQVLDACRASGLSSVSLETTPASGFASVVQHLRETDLSSASQQVDRAANGNTPVARHAEERYATVKNPRLYAALYAGALAASAGASGAQSQIEFDIRIVELPAADVRALFGKKGATPGAEVSDDLLQRLGELKGADILSSPRVLTRPGQSAQIKVGQERSFATSFRVVETNGAWEPVTKTVELGISATVVASPYPHDPERLHGSAEITITELSSVSEQSVTPPGNQTPIKLESPVVSSSELTASFDIASGENIVLGGLECAKKTGDNRSVLVLLRASVIDGNVELIAKLKARVVPSMEFDQAPLGEILPRLAKEAKAADIGFSILCSSLTKSGEKITVRNEKGVEPSVSLSMRDVSLYDLIRFVAKLSGATVTFERNSVTFKLP
jgi:hypothetical protein